jgi:putative flippase GtrA
MKLLFDIFSSAFIMKFLKFGLVGISGVAVDFGTTYFFKEIVKIQKYVANAIGFIVAASSNYLLNRIWTFESHNQIAPEYLRFIIISLIGLGINTLIMWILVSKYKKHFYVSKLFAIGLVTIWNFLMNLTFTFIK